MESKLASRVIRRPAPSSCRYSPYAIGSGYGKKDMKEELVRLGFKLSVSLAESMFLLCDDIPTMLWFCYKLFRDAHHYQKSESRDAHMYLNSDTTVLQRLLRVTHHVYSKYIKPKNEGVLFQDGGNPAQCEFITTISKDFADGIIVLHRLVLLLRRKICSFDDRLLSSGIAKYKQLLKNLEEKLRSSKDVSEANGFARKAMECNIFYFWKSLFNDEEAKEAKPQVRKNTIFSDMFKPLFDHASKHPTFGSISLSELPALTLYSPYILGEDFVKQELKEEVVRLGVELSLYVAESMFLLCDDIYSMLRFCLKLWRDAKRNKKPNNPVVERLLRVIHYVYFKYIKPKKNGVVYPQNVGRSVQLEMVRRTWEDFEKGIRDVDILVSVLRREEECTYVQAFTTIIEETLKKVEEKLRCAKTVSEANGFLNGFAREALKSDVLDMWKSVFDKEAKEARQTMKVINKRILSDLFLPLFNIVPPP